MDFDKDKKKEYLKLSDSQSGYGTDYDDGTVPEVYKKAVVDPEDSMYKQ